MTSCTQLVRSGGITWERQPCYRDLEKPCCRYFCLNSLRFSTAENAKRRIEIRNRSVRHTPSFDAATLGDSDVNRPQVDVIRKCFKTSFRLRKSSKSPKLNESRNAVWGFVYARITLCFTPTPNRTSRPQRFKFGVAYAPQSL